MKSKKALIMISHNTHSFIVSELKYAANYFEYILLLCPANKEISEEAAKYSNIEIRSIQNPKSLKLFARGCCLTRNSLQKELKSALSSHIVSKDYIKLLYLYMTYTALLDNELKDVLKRYCENEIVLLSFWFSATSYATAEMKKRYPSITSISLAHSFEVDEKKNGYVRFLFKKECHDLLDGIYFISRKVRDTYIQKFASQNGWRIDRIYVSYLGVEKKRPELSTLSNDLTFRIVSCSNCVPVKRIDLIARALSRIDNKEIEWIHIGDGPTRNTTESIAAGLPKNIKAVFLGKQTNDFVHRFLAENPVDAFINVSSSEGLPVTLMEAMAYGIPIIATDVGGTSELFVSEIGILLESDPTEETVAEAICSIYDKNRKDIENLRNSVRQCYIDCFDASVHRQKFYCHIAQKERQEGETI